MKPIYINSYEIVSAAGLDVTSFFTSLKHGRHNLNNLDSRWFAKLSDQADHLLKTERDWRHFDRNTAIATLCARQLNAKVAITNDAGCVFGSSRGATETIERAYTKFSQNQHISALTSPTSTMGALSSCIAEELGLSGPVVSISSACLTGLSAIGTAIAYLKADLCHEMVAGGSEAALTPFTFAQLDAAKIYAKTSCVDLPYQPFSTHRSGMILGEGACTLLLSTLPNSEKRCSIVGYAATHESSGFTGVSPDGAGLVAACQLAIDRAGINTSEIDFIVGHGAGTKKGDHAEYCAYQTIYSNQVLPPITSFKWSVGHVLGASGAISVIMAAQILETGSFIPLPYQTEFKQNSHLDGQLKYALVTGLGFGGHAAAAVIRGPFCN